MHCSRIYLLEQIVSQIQSRSKVRFRGQFGRNCVVPWSQRKLAANRRELAQAVSSYVFDLIEQHCLKIGLFTDRATTAFGQKPPSRGQAGWQGILCCVFSATEATFFDTIAAATTRTAIHSMSLYSPIALANIAFTGFSAVSAVLLFIAYVLLGNVPGKSVYSVSSCAPLLTALALIQIGHLQYFLGGPEPFKTFFYRLGLFVAPSMFYCFGRWAILPTEPFRPIQVIYLLPILLPFVVRLEIALPILFAFGAVNSLWLGYVVYGMRDRRKQFRFEFFYFGVMSVFAVIVLGFGFLLPHINHDYFYYFYSSAIGVAFAIMIVALVANPDLVGDLFEAARVKYGASTLRDVDVDACLKKLDHLMRNRRRMRTRISASLPWPPRWGSRVTSYRSWSTRGSEWDSPDTCGSAG